MPTKEDRLKIVVCDAPDKDNRLKVASCLAAEKETRIKLVECPTFTPPECPMCKKWGKRTPLRWAVTVSGSVSCGWLIIGDGRFRPYTGSRWKDGNDGSYVFDQFKVVTIDDVEYCYWGAALTATRQVIQGGSDDWCYDGNGQYAPRCDLQPTEEELELLDVGVYTHEYNNHGYISLHFKEMSRDSHDFGFLGLGDIGLRTCAKSLTVDLEDSPCQNYNDCGKCGAFGISYNGASITVTPEYE